MRGHKRDFRGTAIACVLMGVLSLSATARAGLNPGDMLDQARWQEAKGLMPDAVLRRFALGQHSSKIIKVPRDALRWSTRFNEANQDQELFFGYYKEVYDRAGEYWKTVIYYVEGEDTYHYYRFYPQTPVSSKHLLIIVKHLDGEGFVITCFYARRISKPEKVLVYESHPQNLH